MDGLANVDVTLERLHEIADAFARRDVDGIVNSFAEDGEFRNAKGPDFWGQSYKGKAAIRSYFDAAVRLDRRRRLEAHQRIHLRQPRGHRMAPHGDAEDRREAVVARLRPLHFPPRPDRHEGHLHQGRRLSRRKSLLRETACSDSLL